MKEIEICVVAGSRPDLLKTTLESFQRRLLSHFSIIGAYVNIDPIFGDEIDKDHTVEVVRSYFPEAYVNTPATANFCTAVKHLWGATKSDLILHLEDDWIVNIDITPDMIENILTNPDVVQISFNNIHKKWDFSDGPFHQRLRRTKLFGLKIGPDRILPYFTTSPSFMRGSFARASAGLLDARFDPEKQFYNETNPGLQKAVKNHRNYILGKDQPYLVTDIGRDWRDKRHIQKSFVDGASVWQHDEMQSEPKP